MLTPTIVHLSCNIKKQHKMKTTKLIALLFCFLCIGSCTYDSENDLIETEQLQDENGEELENASVTYENTIENIIQNSCVSCHSSPPVNGAPFALVNYQQVSDRSNNILNAMSQQSGGSSAMPPSGRLPQNTIDQIQIWIDNDLPED